MTQTKNAPMKITVSNLRSAQIVQAGYKRSTRQFIDENFFFGFKVGDQWFSNLKHLKEFLGVKNLREIEFEADRLELGSVTAEFRNVEEGYLWGSYLWNGAFRVGTSADRLVLSN
jgi:hypothetical protein